MINEELYRKCWDAQNLLDAQRYPKQFRAKYLESFVVKKERMARSPEDRPLNRGARSVNKLLNHGMSIEDIQSILAFSEAEVVHYIEFFGLPRKEKKT